MPDKATLERIAALEAKMGYVSTENKRLISLIYGDSGAGKTHLAADILEKVLPKKKGVLVIDTSDNYLRAGLDKRKRFVPQKFTTFEDLSDIITAIEYGIGKYKHIGAVLLDEASSMAESDTDNSFNKRAGEIQDGVRKTPDTGIPDVPEWPDYRRSLVRFRALLEDLYNIDGLHVILTAHEVQDKKSNKFRAAFSPSVLERIVKPMHLVARLIGKQEARGEGEAVYVREVQVHPTNLVSAKCCLPVSTIKFDASALPEIIEEWISEGAVPVETQPEVKDPKPARDIDAVAEDMDQAQSEFDELDEFEAAATA